MHYLPYMKEASTNFKHYNSYNIKGMLHALHPKNILIITITQLFFKTIPTRRLFTGSHLLLYVISAVSFLDLTFFRTLFSHLGTDKENASL